MNGSKMDLDAAIKFEQKTLSMLLKLGGKENEKLGDLYFKLGRLFSEKGDDVSAEANIEKAIEIFERINAENGQCVKAYLMKAGSAARKGDNENAARLFAKAVRIAEGMASKDLPLLIFTYNDAALYYDSVKNPEKAFELADLAVKAGAAAISSDEKARELADEIFCSYRILANLAAKAGENEKARGHFIDLINLFGRNIEEWCDMSNRVGDHYYKEQDFDNSSFFYNLALEKLNETSAQNFWRVKSLYNLALLHKAVGDHGKAINYFKDALEAEIKLSGTATANVYEIYNSLGSAQSEAGDHNGAIFSYSKALETIKKVDPGDQRVIDAGINLGNEHYRHSEFEKALAAYNSALADHSRLKSENFMKSAEINYLIGLANMGLEKPEPALEALKKSLFIYENRGGEMDLNLLHPLFAIIEIFEIQRDSSAITEYFGRLEKIIEDNITLFLDNYSATLDIGRFFIKRVPQKCFALFGRFIEHVKKSLGETNRDYYALLLEIAKIYRAHGFFEQNFAIHEVVIAGAPAVNPVPHDIIGFSYNDMALNRSNAGQYDLAIELFEKSYDSYVAEAGGENYRSTIILTNIADMYFSMGRIEESVITYESVSEKIGKYCDESDGAVSNCLWGLTKAYYSSARKVEGNKTLEKIRNIVVSTHGEISAEVSSFHTRAGNFMIDFKDPEAAMSHFEKALNINLKLVPVDKAAIAVNYKDIGGVYFFKGEHIKALEKLDKQLNLLIECHGDNSPELSSAYGNLGLVYENCIQYEKAYEMRLKAFEVTRNAYGLENRETIRCLDDIVNLYSNQENFSMASKWCEEKIKATSGLCGEGSHETEHALLEFATIKLSMDESKEAFGIFETVYKKHEGRNDVNDPAAGAAIFFMAKILASKERFELALEYARKSKEIFAALKANDMHNDAEDLISEIKRRM